MTIIEEYALWCEVNLDVHTNPAFTETRKRAHGARLKKLFDHYHSKWSGHFNKMVDHMCLHDDNENENGPKRISTHHARRVEEIGNAVDDYANKKEDIQNHQMGHKAGNATEGDIELIRKLHKHEFGSDDL